MKITMIKYSRTTLLLARNWRSTSTTSEQRVCEPPLCSSTWNKLKSLNILRQPRGCRAGSRLKAYTSATATRREFEDWKPCALLPFNRISVLVRHRLYKDKTVDRELPRKRFITPVPKCSAGPTLPRIIPKCLVVNARSLAKPGAAHALQAELSSNLIDLCFISETWLHDNFDKNLVCPTGFTLLTKNRKERIGGGVGIVCRNDWKIKEINLPENEFECLWVEISAKDDQPFYAAALYHPPDPVYNPDDLVEYLEDSCETLLSRNPNAKLILAGDVNQLNLNPLMQLFALSQLVKSATRGTKILDIFLTNAPLDFGKVHCASCLIRSDHKSVIVNPKVKAPSERKWIEFRDTRAHCKLAMLNYLKGVNWSTLLCKTDLEAIVQDFYNIISPAFDECFPKLRAKLSTNDPVFISPLVKHLLKKRYVLIRKGRIVEADTLQPRIDKLIHENQISAVKRKNNKYGKSTKQWWQTVNTITGRQTKDMPLSSLFCLEDVNKYFQEINSDPHYAAPSPVDVPEGTRIPVIEEFTTFKFLSQLKKTAPGPDGLLHWFWRDFAPELTPVITHMFNVSIKSQEVPLLWKLANISPVPKESPITTMNQLRPISVTDIIIRLFERIVYQSEIKYVVGSEIGPDQFAYKEGCNTTLALLKIQHMFLKWLEKDADCVRVFAFDFSKAFDSVNHSTLFNKFKQLPINPYIINWVINFLCCRQQRVISDGKVSPFLDINRGVPQGTILGPILFSVMLNDIKPINTYKSSLTKYADDLTLSVLVKGNNDSSLDEVDNILAWANTNHMSINLTKTKELVVKGKVVRPLPDMARGIIQEPCIKLLGIYFQSDPTNWDQQFNSLLRKAGKRMYILRVCKRYGYTLESLHHIFISLIMSLFTYGISVWGCASYSKYLVRIDRLQNKAVKFGYLKQATPVEDLVEASDHKIWQRVIGCPLTNPLAHLLPPKKRRKLRNRGHTYILPAVKTERFKRTFINRCLFKYI